MCKAHGFSAIVKSQIATTAIAPHKKIFARQPVSNPTQPLRALMCHLFPASGLLGLAITVHNTLLFNGL